MSIQKKFLGSVFLIVVLNLLVKPFYLFMIDAEVQNQVGAADYGLYFSLLNFSFLLNMVLDLGITNYNAKNIAENPNVLSKYLGPILTIKVMLGLVYAFVTIGFALIFGYSNLQMELLGILIVNQFLAGLILYFRSNFTGLHLFKHDALLSVLDRVILIAICSVLLYGGVVNSGFQIEWFVYAQTVAYGVTAVLGLVMTTRKIGFGKFRLHRFYSYAMLRKSTPYALLILLMMLYTRVDAVMLERLLSDGEVQAGIYAQGFRLLDAANIFGLLVAGILLPMFARMIKLKQHIGELVGNAASLLVGLPVIFSLSCVFFAPTLLELIYRNNVAETVVVFPWIILSFIPICVAYIFGTLLTANGNVALLNKIALAGIAVNVVLNFLLIPKYGAYGAAVATLITQTVAALGQMIAGVWMFKLNLNSLLILRLVVTVSLFLGMGWLNIKVGFFQGVYGFVIFGFSGVLMLFATKVLEFKRILELVKR
jgi:O-antigen/teichoic acid export membrane protein